MQKHDKEATAIIELLLNSQEKIKQITSLTNETWLLMKNPENRVNAENYFKEYAQNSLIAKAFAIGYQLTKPFSRALQKNNSSNASESLETIETNIHTHGMHSVEVEDEWQKIEPSSSISDQSNTDKKSEVLLNLTLVKFYENYIKFLNELKAKDMSSRHVLALAQIYLNAVIGNADFFKITELEQFKTITENLIDILNTAKSPISNNSHTRFGPLLTAMTEKAKSLSIL